jgi:hypothetical protein
MTPDEFRVTTRGSIRGWGGRHAWQSAPVPPVGRGQDAVVPATGVATAVPRRDRRVHSLVAATSSGFVLSDIPAPPVSYPLTFVGRFTSAGGYPASLKPRATQDVKNEGTSGDVYEKKGRMTKCHGQNEAFCTKMSRLGDDPQDSVGLLGRKCNNDAIIGMNVRRFSAPILRGRPCDKRGRWHGHPQCDPWPV